MIVAEEARLPYSDDMTNSTDQTFRPNSRNTCPEPGCDEPRGDGFAGTCDEHAPREPGDDVVTPGDLLATGYTEQDALDDGYTGLAEAAQDASINGWLCEVQR